MNSKILTSIFGAITILAGIGVVFFWRDYLIPLFVPMVSGAHQNGSGEILVTDMHAPFKLWLLTSGSGLAIAVLGAAIIALPYLRKDRTMRSSESR